MGWQWAYYLADMIADVAAAGEPTVHARLRPLNLAAKKTALDALATGTSRVEKLKLEILDDPAGTDVAAEKVIAVTVNGRSDAPTVVAYLANGNLEANNPNPVTISVDERITHGNGSQSAVAPPVTGFIAIDDVDANDSPTRLGVNFYRDIDGNGSDEFGTALAGPSYASDATRNAAQTGANQAHGEKIIEGAYGYFVLTWSTDINGPGTAGTPMGWQWAYHQADMIADAAVADELDVHARLRPLNLAAKKTALDALATGTSKVEKLKLEILDALGAAEKVIAVTVNGQNDAPRFTVGGDPAAAENVQLVEHVENIQHVLPRVAADADPVAASTVVAGLSSIDPDSGATRTITLDTAYRDGALFELAEVNGQRVLRWISAPDYENFVGAPFTDAYEVRLQVSDGSLSDTITYRVTVQNNPNDDNDVNLDGTGTRPRDLLQGDNNSNTFLIDDTPSLIREADIIRNFNSGVSGSSGNRDVIRLKHDGAAADATQVNIWYRLATVDGGGAKNDLVIYSNSEGGHSDVNVLAVLLNYAEIVTNDDFHEDVTIAQARYAVPDLDII